MKEAVPRFEAMMSHIEQRLGSGALLERLAEEHPAELVTEVLRAALSQGVVSPGEVLEMIREAHLDLRDTLLLLARKGCREGWDAEAVVLEALQGQPH